MSGIYFYSMIGALSSVMAVPAPVVNPPVPAAQNQKVPANEAVGTRRMADGHPDLQGHLRHCHADTGRSASHNPRRACRDTKEEAQKREAAAARKQRAKGDEAYPGRSGRRLPRVVTDR